MPWPFDTGRQDFIDHLRALDRSAAIRPNAAFRDGFRALLDYIGDPEISAAACALRNHVHDQLCLDASWWWGVDPGNQPEDRKPDELQKPDA